MSSTPTVFLFYSESLYIVGRKQDIPLFLEYLSSLPSLTFVRQKVQGYNCDVKHFVSSFLFYPCSLERSAEYFMLYPVIIISVRGQKKHFNASTLTGQGHVTGDVMPDR